MIVKAKTSKKAKSLPTKAEVKERLQKRATSAQKAGNFLASVTLGAIFEMTLFLRDGFSIALLVSAAAVLVGGTGCIYWYRKESFYKQSIRRMIEREEQRLYEKKLTLRMEA